MGPEQNPNSSSKWLKVQPEMVSLIGLKTSSYRNYKWDENRSYKGAGILLVHVRDVNGPKVVQL